MRLINTQFKGLKLIKGKTFHDSRGFFREILRYKIGESLIISKIWNRGISKDL